MNTVSVRDMTSREPLLAVQISLAMEWTAGTLYTPTHIPW